MPQLQKQAEEDVKIFFERLSAVIERKLSDPVRITKFIKQLDAETIEERAFAFKWEALRDDEPRGESWRIEGSCR